MPRPSRGGSPRKSKVFWVSRPDFHILWEVAPGESERRVIKANYVFHHWRLPEPHESAAHSQGDGSTLAGFTVQSRAEDAIGVLEGDMD